MTLTAAQQGSLVAANLTILPTLGDMLHPHPSNFDAEPGCCPQCCSRCAVTDELDRAGTLDEVVTWAPQSQWRDTSWWREDKVDRVWLYCALACPNQCSESERDEQHSTLVWMMMNLTKRLSITWPQAKKLIVDRLKFENELYDDRPIELNPAVAQL